MPEFTRTPMGLFTSTCVLSRSTQAAGACSLGFQKSPDLTCGCSLHHIGRACFILAPWDIVVDLRDRILYRERDTVTVN